MAQKFKTAIQADAGLTVPSAVSTVTAIVVGTTANLYNPSTDLLKTDDSLEVVGSVKAKGAEVASRAFSMAMC